MNVLINLIVVIIHNVYRYQIFTLFKLNIYTFYLSVNYTSVELGMGRGKKDSLIASGLESLNFTECFRNAGRGSCFGVQGHTAL